MPLNYRAIVSASNLPSRPPNFFVDLRNLPGDKIAAVTQVITHHGATYSELSEGVVGVTVPAREGGNFLASNRLSTELSKSAPVSFTRPSAVSNKLHL